MEVDNRPLGLLFQLQENSPLLERAPVIGTPELHGRVRVALNAFVDKILRKALNNIPLNKFSARDSARYFAEAIDTTYTIYNKDWSLFADKMAIHLTLTDLSNETGMSIVKFYRAVYGLRMTIEAGEQLLNKINEVDHSHVDIVQMH